MRETPPKWNLFTKNCIFIFLCLKFSHLESTLRLMQDTYWDIFPLLKTLFEFIDFDTFQCFCHFLFHLFHIGTTLGFPLTTFSIRENKKSCLGWDWMKRESGAWGTCSQKLLNTEHGVSRWACKWLILKWAIALKESSKKIHRSRVYWNWTQPLTTMPAGTQIQMGSYNTHQEGKSLYYQRP